MVNRWTVFAAVTVVAAAVLMEKLSRMPSQVRAALTLLPLSVHFMWVVCSHDKHTSTLASLAGMLRVMRRIAHPSQAHHALQ
jgi:hypothetical protein